MRISKEELSAMPVSTKQYRIAKIARQNSQEPITLVHNYMDTNWLKEAYKGLRKKSAPGIDRETVEQYGIGLDEKLEKLLYLAKSGRYKAPAVLRKNIPKPGSSETRPIGIPTTEDKVLQKAVHMLLSPIYEQEFYEFSFGFIAGRSAHQGLQYVWDQIMGNNIHWIIDLDIRKFFDSVKHEELRNLLQKRVRDGVILRLVGKWLNAGVMEDGGFSYPEKGTPQGGIISPLLCNIYLHEVLDKWYVQTVRPRLAGRSFMARFADDAILGFENRRDAERVLTALGKRLLTYGLELHPEKTRLVYFGKPRNKKDGPPPPKPGTFDFLGFKHYWTKSKKGNWVVGRKTAGKKFREKLRTISLWIKTNRHLPVRYQHEKLSQKLRGHYSYYGITGNARSLANYRHEVNRIWKKWLCRRSWKGKRLNWDRYRRTIMANFPLPPFKIVHSIFSRSKTIT